jgi:hypothetical protein
MDRDVGAHHVVGCPSDLRTAQTVVDDLDRHFGHRDAVPTDDRHRHPSTHSNRKTHSAPRTRRKPRVWDDAELSTMDTLSPGWSAVASELVCMKIAAAPNAVTDCVFPRTQRRRPPPLYGPESKIGLGNVSMTVRIRWSSVVSVDIGGLGYRHVDQNVCGGPGARGRKWPSRRLHPSKRGPFRAHLLLPLVTSPTSGHGREDHPGSGNAGEAVHAGLLEVDALTENEIADRRGDESM